MDACQRQLYPLVAGIVLQQGFEIGQCQAVAMLG